ncbi:MAG TPA: hypothetical protein VNO30_02420 [Kofleriaceae bacterium]|nr:hypothetical protein [Kofleriaceae bacterium]
MADLANLLASGSSRDRAEWLFRALYAAPASHALEVARFALSRYLPIFRSKHPAIVWPAELLADPGAWVEKHETGLVDDPDHDSADTSFRHGLHALLVAWVHRDDHAQRTAAAVVAIRTARSAFQTNVWAADDPEAFTAWATGDLVNARRTLEDNAAAAAVGEREWLAVVGRLATPAASPGALDAALERWRARDHALL